MKLTDTERRALDNFRGSVVASQSALADVDRWLHPSPNRPALPPVEHIIRPELDHAMADIDRVLRVIDGIFVASQSSGGA